MKAPAMVHGTCDYDFIEWDHRTPGGFRATRCGRGGAVATRRGVFCAAHAPVRPSAGARLASAARGAYALVYNAGFSFVLGLAIGAGVVWLLR